MGGLWRQSNIRHSVAIDMEVVVHFWRVSTHALQQCMSPSEEFIFFARGLSGAARQGCR